MLELGSWSAAIVDELGETSGDIHVAKYAMSGFWETHLDSILRNQGVTTLLFAGVNLDQCVLCTLQDASFRGYDCVLVEECCATTSPAFCAEATLYNIRQCFGFVTSCDALNAALSVSGMSFPSDVALAEFVSTSADILGLQLDEQALATVRDTLRGVLIQAALVLEHPEPAAGR